MSAEGKSACLRARDDIVLGLSRALFIYHSPSWPAVTTAQHWPGNDVCKRALWTNLKAKQWSMEMLRGEKNVSLPQLNISSRDEVIGRISFPFWLFHILKLVAGNWSICFPSMFTPRGIYWHAQTVCVAPLPLVRSDEGAKVKPQDGRHRLNQWASSDWPAGHIYGCGRLIRDHFPGLERQGSRTAAGQHWTPTRGSL